MAFLGGLFGDIKTSDVLTGVAERGSEILKKQREDADETVSRVAQYQIQKNFDEQERYQTELRDNVKAIEQIRGLAGSIDGAEYLVRTYGLEQALEEAKTLKALNDTFGIKPNYANPDSINTVEEIARFATAQPTVLKTPLVKDTSFLGKIGLGRDLGAEVQAKVDSSVDSFAYDKPDLGAMPIESGEAADKTLLLDLKQQAGINLTKAQRAKDANEPELYKKFMGKAQEIAINLNMLENGTKPLSDTLISRISTETNNQIFDVSGIASDTNISAGLVIRTPKKDETKNNIKMVEANSAVINFFDRGKAQGFSSADLYSHRKEAINQNKLPIINDDGELGFSNEPLIPGGLIGGQGAYAHNPNYGKTQAEIDSDIINTDSSNLPTEEELSGTNKKMLVPGQPSKTVGPAADLAKYKEALEKLKTEKDKSAREVIIMQMMDVQRRNPGVFKNPVTLDDI